MIKLVIICNFIFDIKLLYNVNLIEYFTNIFSKYIKIFHYFQTPASELKILVMDIDILFIENNNNIYSL